MHQRPAARPIRARFTASRRKLSVLAALVISFVTLGTVIGSAGIASASVSRSEIASASAAVTPDTPPPFTIHLTNASSYCIDVKNDNNQAGAAVWLYKCSQAKSDHWNEFEYECPGQEGQPQCFVLVDAANTNLCFGLTDNRTADLQNCGNHGDLPSNYAVWNAVANHGLRDTGWGVEGDLWSPTATSKATLYGEDRTAGGGGWWEWSGF